MVPSWKGRRLRNVTPDELFAAHRGLAGPVIATNLRHAQHWLFCTPFECLDEFGKQGSVRRHIPAIVFHTSVSLHKPRFSMHVLWKQPLRRCPGRHQGKGLLFWNRDF